ncbi:MAG: transcription termination/antitermination protein NusA [Candidatus Magasanikbacteria bacterium]|nr:transcription termination/antitermination protein NusA [Candidatus Magasanikbacteria bacterium]
MSDITKAIQALCDEKGLTYDAVMETIEAALAAAYRKDFGNKQQNIKVKFDPATGNMQAWDVKTVVPDIAEDVLEKAQDELMARREKAREEGRELTEEETADLPRFNPKTEMMLSQAKEVKKKAEVGEVLEISLEIPHEFGRMAAQTAKQVIIQKIREAERAVVFGDFKGQEGTLILGTVQRVEGRKVLIDLGKITGIMPSDQMIFNEHYRPGARMKFFVVKVEMTARGPEIILSRAATGMVREVFRQEIPEVASGVIQIKGVARDAGFRSKVAVATDDSSIDPIGSCIGQRGSRINTVIEELGGEKIDVIQYDEDAAGYVTHALSPAKVVSVELNDAERTATVTVAPEQFSIAIGRSGQNVRLASELTGWKINVVQLGGETAPSAAEAAAEEPAEPKVAPEIAAVEEKAE